MPEDTEQDVRLVNAARRARIEARAAFAALETARERYGDAMRRKGDADMALQAALGDSPQRCSLCGREFVGFAEMKRHDCLGGSV